MREAIDAQPDLVVSAEAEDGSEIIARLRYAPSDALVLGHPLPGASGIDIINQVRAEHPSLKVLVLSGHRNCKFAIPALRAGAHGYLTKRESVSGFLAALRNILRGTRSVGAELAGQLIYRVAGQPGPATEALSHLSKRELEILTMLGKDPSTARIAQALDVSIKTVESHRLHLKAKLGLKTWQELVRFAHDWVTFTH